MDETPNTVLEQQRKKALELKNSGVELYPNSHKVEQSVPEVLRENGPRSADDLEASHVRVSVAGRMMALRSFGKAAFIHIQDDGERIQVYVKRDTVGKETYSVFKKLDVGDILRVEGRLFRTKTAELTVLAEDLVLLSKAQRTLPEKFHWLTDKEMRYRQRYLDLIGNPEVRKTFIKRTRIVQEIRAYLTQAGFLEVETPMMQSIAGGATARPFTTHHNALDMDLYLRVAPELYLKRLIVGGFNRVFELNRNFRNEGISLKHNPEFTMLEFYQAYATFEDMMDRTEDLFNVLCRKLEGDSRITYQGETIDFTRPWKRVEIEEALIREGGVDESALRDMSKLESIARDLDIPLMKKDTLGKLWAKLFDVLVEPKLVQPTFVTMYPLDVSPLSRRNDAHPEFVDRFELFIGGREIANAFSELNDPMDQRKRFEGQLEDLQAGDVEAHRMDEDYIHALEYGMPPTAGEGIGVDRVVMLFTDSASIRDVILFPQMRPSHSNR